MTFAKLTNAGLPRLLRRILQTTLLMAGLLAVLLPLSPIEAAENANPFAGIWNMSVARSRYPAGGLPQSMTIHLEPSGNGEHYRSEAKLENGTVSVVEYKAQYDERPVSVAGANGMMPPIALKRVDANTVVATYARPNELVATSRRVLSANGRTMTITTVSKGSDGNEITIVGVYLRASSDKGGSDKGGTDKGGAEKSTTDKNITGASIPEKTTPDTTEATQTGTSSAAAVKPTPTKSAPKKTTSSARKRKQNKAAAK
jgi:hypothetical protein